MKSVLRAILSLDILKCFSLDILVFKKPMKNLRTLLLTLNLAHFLAFLEGILFMLCDKYKKTV